MKSFKDLNVWKKGMEIAKITYLLTRTFPEEEKYGIVSQMRRTAVSIPSNIAEGKMRSSDKEFSRFLSIALGSCAELQTQLMLCVDIGYLTQEQTIVPMQILEELFIKIEKLQETVRKDED